MPRRPGRWPNILRRLCRWPPWRRRRAAADEESENRGLHFTGGPSPCRLGRSRGRSGRPLGRFFARCCGPVPQLMRPATVPIRSLSGPASDTGFPGSGEGDPAQPVFLALPACLSHCTPPAPRSMMDSDCRAANPEFSSREGSVPEADSDRTTCVTGSPARLYAPYPGAAGGMFFPRPSESHTVTGTVTVSRAP